MSHRSTSRGVVLALFRAAMRQYSRFANGTEVHDARTNLFAAEAELPV